MYASVLNITFDCADAKAQAEFWAAVTGDRLGRPRAGRRSRACRVRRGGTTVPEPKQVKNRVHLDLLPPGDQQAELARLTSLGAVVLEEQPPGVGWVVLADPEGNEFCLEG
jgi:predicted enzyme related to lactoylglutathione lyase